MKQFKNKNIIKLPFELQPVLVESVYFPLQISNLRFESSVILNGSKTCLLFICQNITYFLKTTLYFTLTPYFAEESKPSSSNLRTKPLIVA